MNKTQYPDCVILCGDGALFWNNEGRGAYGLIYPIFSDEALQTLKPGKSKIFWLPGNHECYDVLQSRYDRYSKDPIKIKENVFYCPLGTTLTINGKTCVFVGGALSIDKEIRTKGVNWFPEEILTEQDFQAITAISPEADIVFSHTCPSEFDIQDKWDHDARIEDPTREVLSKLMNHYKPKYWFFGHWHRQKGGVYDGVQWQGLNTISSGYGNCGRFALDISEIFTKD